jgi:membrane protease YdiL (CAAX protease family)
MLPLLLFMGTDLLAPYGLRWGTTLGIPARRGTEWRLLLLAAAALAIDVSGALAILGIAARIGSTESWTEAVLEDLLFPPAWYRLLVAIEVTVLVPFVEEILFRGLVYPTFRRVGRPLVAAIASGALFAVVHGYGGLGTATLLWGGTIAALAYEWTGTLLVPFLVHAATNAAVVAAHWRMLGQ